MLRNYIAVLKLKGYRWFWLGATINSLGSQVGSLGLTWFVKELTGSSVAVGTSLSLGQLALAMGSLLVGPVLDRYSRRGLMFMDNALRGLLYLLLPLMAWMGWLELWHIYIVMAAGGFLSAFSRVGAAAITPALVGDSRLLPVANALNQVIWQIAYLLGPGLGGALVIWFRPESVVLVDGVTFLLFALVIVRLPAAVDATRQTGASYLSSLKEGAGWLFGSRPLLALTLYTLLFNLFYGPLPVALAFYADEALQGGAGALGWLWTAFAAGSLVGGVVGGGVGRLPTGRVLAVIMLLWGIFTGPMALVTSLPLAGALIFLAGASWAPYNVVAATARQRVVPPHAYGRVFGLTLVITQLGGPAGAWIGGILVERVGAPATIGLAAVGTLVMGLTALLSSSLYALDAATEANQGVH